MRRDRESPVAPARGDGSTASPEAQVYNGRLMRSAAALRRLGLLVGLAAAGCSPGMPAEPTAYFAPAVTAAPTAAQPTAVPVLAAPTAACSNAASFVEDLTVPDGTVVSPGDRLDKRWAVQNSGSCDWGAEYRLVRVDSGDLVGPEALALYPARAGQSAVWQVELVAPQESGEYLASWQARAPDGEFFGEQVFVLIEVRP
jgi:hypothetical protein